MARQFIEIIAKHDVKGNIHPLSIVWEDGRVFSVDRVIDVRQAGAMKAGGCGTRYTCKVHGKEVYLFHEEGQWYLDK